MDIDFFLADEKEEEVERTFEDLESDLILGTVLLEGRPHWFLAEDRPRLFIRGHG
jgi:hypothetical protein